MNKEAIVVRGELELVGRDACHICLGVGKYACVHCEGKSPSDLHQSYLFDECRACGEKGEHICPRCGGLGRCETFEDIAERVSDEDPLRDINLDGYRLQMWDLGKRDNKKGDMRELISYRLTSPEGVVIFEGEDYSCSPLSCIDGDESVRGLIGFLTLRPGDTDDEYFYCYNSTQWEFAQGPAEQLSLWALDPKDCEGLDDLEQDENRDLIWFKPWPEDEEVLRQHVSPRARSGKSW